MRQAVSVLIANIPMLLMAGLAYVSLTHGHPVFAGVLILLACFGLHIAGEKR